ncbi:Patellin-5 [Cardamine amara subsp. amara]|uniref:Patellin-5 n=1 Tax=Cardamine amara subsp. amara TaxID=228776 RepID=A0ABD0ZN46_CARAN
MSQDSATTTPTPPPPSTADDSMLYTSHSKNKEEDPKEETLEPEVPEPKEHAAEESEQPHQVIPETVALEKDSSLLVISEPEELNHTAEDDSEKPHIVTLVTEPGSELNHAAEDDSRVTQQTEPEEPNNAAEETEPTPKLMLEQRNKYTDVSDWTEPELPDAAVLEAAASVPEEKQPKPHSSEVATPPSHTTSSVESRSLAEMMNREEAEAEEKQKIPRSLGSFKEETNKISDLSEPELNALHELRNLLQESSQDSYKSFIWGVPLLKDERSDVVLLKFLRARDFKPQEAYTMLNKTLQWRLEFNIEELLDENLGDDLDKVVFMQGHDKENHPVCYNVYGEFQNKDLYQKTFSDEEKRERFLRWRIQFLEKSIRNLDFVPGGVSTICQVNDLKNSPGPGKTELRLATKQALHLLQDNYPEFVSKQIFINVPWWYLAFYKIISPFMTQRSKSKLVFAGPSRSAETLFKYISPEHVPVQYGGLSVDNCDCNSDFTHDDIATVITVKPSTKQTVEIIIYEKCTIVWEIRVVGWEVSYGAEFVPENQEGYTVIIQKPRKMAAKDEPVVSQSFKVGEVGKILLTVDNPTSTKKMLIYRFKVKPLQCE